MSRYKYILINGFGWSGSSALVDMMREFEGFYVPNKEFRLIKDPHGVRDLDMAINQSTDQLNEDRAMREFIHFIEVYARKAGGFHPLGLSYNDDFGREFYNLGLRYIDDITDYTYSGYWWYLDYDKPYIKYIFQKTMKRLRIKDYTEHTRMRLTIKSEEEFLKITRRYIDAIFEELLMGQNINTVVLDQAIPANRPSWAGRYFDDARVLVVDRDPRDVYIDLIAEKSLVGYDVAVHHDVRLFTDWFRKVRREDSVAGASMRIQFEELVLNYDRTIGGIYDYCDIDPAIHRDVRSRFNPDVSKKNIGMWKTFEHQDEIRQIEAELKEYLVQ